MADSEQDRTEAYRARFRSVLDYIDAHAAETLSVERLSRVAASSKHHFHRQFSAMFDVGVHEYVKAVRLTRASDELGFRYWRSVLEVALDSGYESPEAFARAFKKHFGQTPSQFQRAPDWRARDQRHRSLQTIRSAFMVREFQLDDVKIIDFPATAVAVFTHRGDPALVPQSVRRLIEWRREVGLTPPGSATFNIFWTDPAAVSPDDYRMDLCIGTNGTVPANDLDIVAGTIPAGRCAVLSYVGPAPLHAPIGFLYRHWLPRSGETPRDYPLFLQRFPSPEARAHEATVDIHLPLV